MRMRHIKDRALRHGSKEEFDQVFSSDVSSIKKLKLREDKEERIRAKGKLKGAKEDGKGENFAGKTSNRRAQKKPTASEERNI